MAANFQVPPEVLKAYFVPYEPTRPPSLYGTPIQSDTGSGSNNSGAIRLWHSLLHDAHIQLAEAFEKAENPPPSPSNSSHTSPTLPVSVLCSPHQDSNIAVDAAIRYLGHHLHADVVIIDLIDLMSRSEVFGSVLVDAFWQLYRYHLLDNESSDVAESVKLQTAEHAASVVQAYLGMGLSGPYSEPTDDPIVSALRSKGLWSGLDSDSDSDADSDFKAFRQRMGYKSRDNKPRGSVRRLIYLRDMSAVSKVILPLMPLLLDAITSTPSSILVAGLSPITRGSPEAASSQLRRFFDRLDDEQEWCFRLAAQWRRPEAAFMGSECYLSLDDVFAAAFINRYQARLFKQRPDELKLAVDVQVPKFEFERFIRVATVEEPSGALNSTLGEEMAQRWRSANQYRLRRIWESTYGHGEKDMSDILTSVPAGSFGLSAIATRALTWNELERAAKELSRNKYFWREQANALWQQLKNNSVTVSRVTKSAGPAILDPILQREKQAGLKEDEKVFLEYVVDPTTIRTTFSDVRLKPDIIDALRTAVTLPILFPEAFNTGILAREPLGGVLLFGPPGTGKTMACRALAKESGARMLHLKASNILACLVGQSEKLITGAFSLARRLAPCVLFIDEMDALFSKRTGDSKPWHRSMLTEFMQEMDGLLSADSMVQKRVVVIGATNHPQDLDSALVRRLPRRVMVDLPNLQERKDILTHYLNEEKFDDSISIHKLGARTQLFSGSDLRHLVVAAALAAFKESTKVVWQLQYDSDGLPKPAELQLAPRVLSASHFDQALRQVAACGATNRKELEELRRWEKELFQSEFCS